MDVDIAPEPTEGERALLDAFVRADEEATRDDPRSGWGRAALEEGTAGEDGYGSAPPL